MSWRNAKKAAEKILKEISKHRYLIVFDTETTGLKKTSKIIQFTGWRYRITEDFELEPLDEVTECLDLYIKPVDKGGKQEPLDPKITEITGITDEMLSYGQPETERFGVIRDFLNTASIWAAYNSPFDIKMLLQMEKRINEGMENKGGRPYEETHFESAPVIDVLPAVRDCLPDAESYKLSEVFADIYPEKITKNGFKNSRGTEVSFHDSKSDVEATGMVLNWCLEQYRDILEEKDGDKERPILKYAYYTENPRQTSQKRIKIALSGEEEYVTRYIYGNLKTTDIGYGRIYWDIVKKCWGRKEEKKAKSLFDRIDLASLEDQMLERYGRKYGADSMEELGKEMAKAFREKQKEEKKKT